MRDLDKESAPAPHSGEAAPELPEQTTYPASQLQICTSFKDGKAVFVIVRRTSAQHSVITDMGDSFASRSLAESALAKLSGKPVPDGTFACPICGKDAPHEHSSAEVAQHRIDRTGSKWAPIGEAGGVVAEPIGALAISLAKKHMVDAQNGYKRFTWSGIVSFAIELRDSLAAQPQAAPSGLSDLLGRYWELAFDEGKRGVSHGTEAQEVLSAIVAAAQATGSAS
jgi:hypothetical protein